MKCPKCGHKIDLHKIAVELGSKGGSVVSEAKAKAARENGKKGGAPRKKLDRVGKLPD